MQEGWINLNLDVWEHKSFLFWPFSPWKISGPRLRRSKIISQQFRNDSSVSHTMWSAVVRLLHQNKDRIQRKRGTRSGFVDGFYRSSEVQAEPWKDRWPQTDRWAGLFWASSLAPSGPLLPENIDWCPVQPGSGHYRAQERSDVNTPEKNGWKRCECKEETLRFWRIKTEIWNRDILGKWCWNGIRHVNRYDPKQLTMVKSP